MFKKRISISIIAMMLLPLAANGSAVENSRENLALAENGTYVLSSSFKESKTFYTDNVIDGNEKTMWRSWDETFPQWLELRWTYPLKINEAAFHEVAPSFSTEYSIYSWQNSKWKLVKAVFEKPKTKTGYQTCTFDEVTTDRLRLVIERGQGKYTQISELQVYGPKQPLIEKMQPYWKSWYIWYPEPDKTHKGNAPRYFRKTFEIDDLEKIVSAYAQFRSNDYYKAFLNGVEVATGSTVIKPASVKEHLKKGKNVISIVTDLVYGPGRWGYGELIAEISLNYRKESKYIRTDSSWKSHDKMEPSWESIDFDDSTWKPSAPYVQPPEGPWGKIPYFGTMTKEKVYLEDIAISPKNLKPGDTANIELYLSPVENLAHNYVFVFEIGDKEINSARQNYLLKKVTAEPQIETARWKKK